jgi:uridine phosphorylase
MIFCLFIHRLGTCGTLVADDEIGQYVVNTSSRMVTRNVDVFAELLHPESIRTSVSPSLDSYYHVSRPAFPSVSLNNLLLDELKQSGEPYCVGANASADSFYSSQGRLENGIIDCNFGMLEVLRDDYDIRTLEMETFQLFHLAECCKIDAKRSIEAAAMMIVVANRPKNTFIVSDERKHHLEQVGGILCLNALINLAL